MDLNKLRKGKLKEALEKIEAAKAASDKKPEQKTKHKFNVDVEKCKGFDSWFEKQIADNLERMKSYYDFDYSYHDDKYNIHYWYYNKYNSLYEQINVDKSEIVNDKIHHIYKPDFVLHKDGSDILIESKGYLSTKDRTKMLRIKELYPHLDIRFVFQVKQKLKGKNGAKLKKEIYNTEWAEQNNFEYSVGAMLPKKWFK